MRKNMQVRFITIKDLFKVLKSRIWIMIGAAALVVVLMFVAINVTYVPVYDSTATLYILKQDGSDSKPQYDNSSDFSLALNVVNDCTFLLKSHAVIDEVKEELKLDISYEELVKSVSTNNPDKTRILQVTVKSDTPEKAKKIADCVCKVGVEKITDAMGFKQANFYEYGVLNTKPCNRVGILYYLLAGVAAAVLCYVIFLIIYILDDNIRTNEEIQQYLGLNVLGEIPNANEDNKKNYKNTYHYKYYRSDDENEGDEQ